MAEYRTLTDAEIPEAVRLWVHVFGEEPAFFQSLLDGGDPDDVSLGAFADGRLVSSVHVFMRWFRDREGRPLKVGGIGSVSTLPDFRRQGHSARLLDMAIDEMAARECTWTYLGTGVHRHYARHGWRTFSTPSSRAVLLPPLPGYIPRETVVVTEELCIEMAALHAKYTVGQPMANRRSDAMWRHAAKYRVSRPGDEVSTDYGPSELTGYFVTHRKGDSLELIEAVGRNLPTLAAGCLEQAATAGVRRVTNRLPPASPVAETLADLSGATEPAEETGWMARPIADRISWVDLAAILYDPRGRRSELDNF